MEINKNIFDIFDSTEMRYNKIFSYFKAMEEKKEEINKLNGKIEVQETYYEHGKNQLELDKLNEKLTKDQFKQKNENLETVYEGNKKTYGDKKDKLKPEIQEYIDLIEEELKNIKGNSSEKFELKNYIKHLVDDTRNVIENKTINDLSNNGSVVSLNETKKPQKNEPIKDTTQNSGKEYDKYSESIHEYLVKYIYNRFIDCDAFDKYIKNEGYKYEIDLEKLPKLKIMYFEEEKCLKLFENLYNKEEFEKEKKEYKEKLKKEEDFKKIFLNDSAGGNVLKATKATKATSKKGKANKNSTEPDYCQMFSTHIYQKDKNGIDGLLLYVFLQFREIEFIEKSGPRDLFLNKYLFKFIKILNNDYSAKVAYLKELLENFKELYLDNKDKYTTIKLQNKLFLTSSYDIDNIKLEDTLKNFTKLYANQFYDLYNDLHKDSNNDSRDKLYNDLYDKFYKEYTESLFRHNTLELSYLFTKFNFIDKDKELNHKKYMKDRFLIDLNKNLPLSKYTLIKYDGLRVKLIKKESDSIIDIVELKKRLIDLQLYNNIDYSEINLRILMYGIYGKKDIDDDLKKEVFGSKDEFDKIFNKDVLFEKFRNIARALFELKKEGYLSASIKVKDHALERINNNFLYLIDKCKTSNDIKSINFTLEELLAINLKMEEYFYNYSESSKDIIYNNGNLVSDISLTGDLKSGNVTFNGKGKTFSMDYVDAIFILVAYVKYKFSTDLKKFEDNHIYLTTREYKRETNAMKNLYDFLSQLYKFPRKQTNVASNLRGLEYLINKISPPKK